MKRKALVILICIVILAVLLAGCASSGKQSTSKERANLEALLKEIYGASAVVRQPELDQYFVLLPRYVDYMYMDHTLMAVQQNVTVSDENFYMGELYSCAPEREKYASGEDIRINVTSHNPNFTTGGERFRLDMLADGKWYAVNRASTWGLVQYEWTEGKEITYGVSGYLNHFHPLEIDPETGLLVNSVERDISPVKLPAGTYRFSTWVTDTVKGEDYQLTCQFQVTGG